MKQNLEECYKVYFKLYQATQDLNEICNKISHQQNIDKITDNEHQFSNKIFDLYCQQFNFNKKIAKLIKQYDNEMYNQLVQDEKNRYTNKQYIKDLKNESN